LRGRTGPAHGHFVASDNKRPEFTLKDAIENPRRDVQRMALAPATFLHEHEKIHDRWPAATRFVREHGLNEFLGQECEGPARIGLMVQGGLYNTLIRALDILGLADIWGDAQLPIYVMNVVYPMVEEEATGFCQGRDAVLMLEEGQPEFIEQTLQTVLRRADMSTRVHGKDMLPRAGEYTTLTMVKGLRKFLQKYAPHLLERKALDAGVASMLAPKVIPVVPSMPGVALQEAPGVLPRPPSFCTGCPERPIFTAIKLVEREIGKHHVSADIGCHQFAALAPFDFGATSMGYGLGAAGAAALNVEGAKRRTISVMGDGGFWHNGLTSGVGNAVFNKSDNVIVVIDNGYSAATGGQDILSSRAQNANRVTALPIEAAARGVGVRWLRKVSHTYSLKSMKAAIRDALTSGEAGPKQRRVKPQLRERAARGERVMVERFGIDPDTCTGDHSCIRLSGCPSLSIRPNPDPLRKDPIATVQSSCVGCGLCGEVSHAAVLCPSFYRTQLVTHAGRAEKFIGRITQSVIGLLQRRLAAREFVHVA
jgi:indolepyruvate ferredoxin oxidoreductase alpha subunit